MHYSETIKKSQTKKVAGGYQKDICCKLVTKVTNENNESLKFSYNTHDEVLTILSEDFNLLTVEYDG